MWDVDLTLMHSGGVAREAYHEAFLAVTGLRLDGFPDFAGRTDLDTAAEVFARHGVGADLVEAFFTRYADAFAARRDQVARRAEVLPGAAEVLAALAARPDVVQTVVTGNIRPVAEIKLDAVGLAGYVDLDAGGYGTDDGVRATLVRRSRERAEARYGRFAEVMVIGDTGYDVAGALANRVTAVGVASGRTSAADLKAAGAHLVFDSLAEVDEVVRVLAGGPLPEAAA